MDIVDLARYLSIEDLLKKLNDQALLADERAQAAIALVGKSGNFDAAYQQREVAHCEDERVFAAIETYFSHESWQIKRWAIQALVWLKRYQPTPDSLPRLRALFEEGNKQIQYDIVELIGRCKHPDAIAMLKPLLKRKEAGLTNRVFMALGNTEQPVAISILLENIRYDAAVRTLARISSGRAVNATLKILREKPHNDIWGILLQTARQLDMKEAVRECENAIDTLNLSYPPR
jgi:HEAT repeat protein